MLRYSKINDEWEVYRDTSLIYTGTKEKCKAFMKNTGLAAS